MRISSVFVRSATNNPSTRLEHSSTVDCVYIHAVVRTKHLAASFGVFCEFCVVFPREIFIGSHCEEAVIPSLNSFVTTPVSPPFIFHSSLCRSPRRRRLIWRMDTDRSDVPVAEETRASLSTLSTTSQDA
nr:PREDICTED: uncharacterized protein LOC105663990 [Megachile rotundata]